MRLLSTLFLTLGALIFGTPLFSQSLRSEVALVKPKLSDTARAGFITVADSLAKQGYTDLAEYFRGWAEGGHGSGVLVAGPGGTVLVTNRHVAAFSESADYRRGP